MESMKFKEEDELQKDMERYCYICIRDNKEMYPVETKYAGSYRESTMLCFDCIESVGKRFLEMTSLVAK